MKINLEKFIKKKQHKVFEGKLTFGLQNNNIQLFIDVGANFGQSALGIIEWGYTNEIISIEPVKECHDYLIKKSTKYNNWKILERMAVGDKDGEAEINVSKATDLSSILKPTELLKNSFDTVESHHKEKIPIRRLDTLFNIQDIPDSTFIKIDTQGYDYNVLLGAEKIISKVKGIQIEASLLPLYQNEKNYYDILTFLKDLGFVTHMITERSFSRRVKRQLQIEIISFKKD